MTPPAAKPGPTRPSILVIDDEPGMAETLANIKLDADLPVILVTGYRTAMSEAIEAALEIGACTCLYKPLGIEQLCTILVKLCHRSLASALAI